MAVFFEPFVSSNDTSLGWYALVGGGEFAGEKKCGRGLTGQGLINTTKNN